MADYILYTFSELTTKFVEISVMEKYSAMDNPKCIYLSWSSASKALFVITKFDVNSIEFNVECERVAEEYKEYLQDLASLCTSASKLKRRMELQRRVEALDYFMINYLNSEIPY